MQKMVRSPAMAGLFYPDDPKQLAEWVDSFTPPTTSQPALGIIAPHAGLRYSGGVAGATIAQVTIPATTLILCPKHTRFGAKTAIMTHGSWSMPGGTIAIDEDLAKHLQQCLPNLTEDDQAHAEEHAIEVLLPFLQKHRPDGRFVPIAMDYRSLKECQALGHALGQALNQWPESVLLLSSTDMNHFEDQDTTRRKDQLALDQILALNPEGLYNTCQQHNISMCGVVPTTITLYALQHLGLHQATLIQHTTSAAVSGETQRVVGYAGLVLK